MQIAIVYETVEGQTQKIVDVIAGQLRGLGHEVRLFDTAKAEHDLSLAGIDRVILAAPVHERRHPERFELTLQSLRDTLAARPTLMLSVSLKAAFPAGVEEAQDYLTECKMRTGFEPTQEALVAGAVRMAGYDYFQSQIVRHVALQGQDCGLSDGVREFTDWGALARQVQAFTEG